MPDSRYLDGDPDEVAPPSFTDMTPFVQSVHRELKCIHDLIKAKRYEEAGALAIDEYVAAGMILKNLEAPLLPEVDLARTKDAATTERFKRVYKTG